MAVDGVDAVEVAAKVLYVGGDAVVVDDERYGVVYRRRRLLGPGAAEIYDIDQAVPAETFGVCC